MESSLHFGHFLFMAYNVEAKGLTKREAVWQSRPRSGLTIP